MALEAFAQEIEAIGRELRAEVGEEDVRTFRRLRRISRLAEVTGRIALHLSSGPLSWIAGVATLAFHLALEAQLNHSVQHGAYAGLPGGAARSRYETIALPLQTRTWRDAHRIHHANPSLLEADPDTVHPFFRVHPDTPWRWWHLGNLFLGTIFVFETWGRDYDVFLKRVGARPREDRSERWKLVRYVLYQYVLFSILAGESWWRVLAGCLAAGLMRNVAYVVLQTASSVGANVSTVRAFEHGPKKKGEWYRFQVETSKNYRAPAFWTLFSGGLDRHIEHHLFPRCPPTRLRAISPRVRALCEAHGVRYEEHPSPWASLQDSLRHLASLSRPGR